MHLLKQNRPEPDLPQLSGLRCFHCPARTSDLCGGVPDRDLDDLARHSTHVTLEPGRTLILDGDAAERVYNVVRGTMMLTRIGRDGRRQVLAFLLPGHFVGLSSDRLYHFNAEAVTEVELCRFERTALDALFAEHPQTQKRFRDMAAKIVEAALDLVFTLGRRSATERVAAFLIYFRDAQAHACGLETGPAIGLPMTRTDIGDYLGLTIETVSRVLSRLKAKGFIRLPTLHSYEILDEDGLAAAAGLDG